jgi:hypothetical protein
MKDSCLEKMEARTETGQVPREAKIKQQKLQEDHKEINLDTIRGVDIVNSQRNVPRAVICSSKSWALPEDG